jgi:hypothetical protein
MTWLPVMTHRQGTYGLFQSFPYLLLSCTTSGKYLSKRAAARVIHDGSSANRTVALRDRHALPREVTW